jgi:hypothetical protein
MLSFGRALALFVTLMTFEASAYIVAFMKGSPGAAFDYQRASRIFLVGYSGGLANQFMESAYFRAALYQKIDPESQIVFLRPPDFKTLEEDRKKTELPGIEIVEAQTEGLTGQAFVQWLERFPRIRSLDIYSHSSPVLGVGIQNYSPDYRFSEKSPGVEALRDNFIPEQSYAILHGCNSGMILAPALAKLWAVPVQGSLTGTDFQQWSTLEPRDWYFNNAPQHPKTPKWKYCQTAFCRRMKPQETPYSGGWGTYTHGLNFLKTFCSPEASLETCEKLMAESLMGFAHAKTLEGVKSLEDFAQLAEDFICPIVYGSQKRKECVAALRRGANGGSRVYTGMQKGKTAKCDAFGCKIEVRCKKRASGELDMRSCRDVAEANLWPTEYVDEYLRFLRGFAQR